MLLLRKKKRKRTHACWEPYAGTGPLKIELISGLLRRSGAVWTKGGSAGERASPADFGDPELPSEMNPRSRKKEEWGPPEQWLSVFFTRSTGRKKKGSEKW